METSFNCAIFFVLSISAEAASNFHSVRPSLVDTWDNRFIEVSVSEGGGGATGSAVCEGWRRCASIIVVARIPMIIPMDRKIMMDRFFICMDQL